MKIVHVAAYLMALIFIVGETFRRGLDYFSINATTMIEDYLCGALLLWAAVFWSKKQKMLWSSFLEKLKIIGEIIQLLFPINE